MDINNINYNNESNNGNNGNRGKFSDRLKKMRIDRLKLRKGKSLRLEKKETFFVRFFRNVLKIFLAMPSVAISVIKTPEKKSINKVNVDSCEVNSINNKRKAVVSYEEKLVNDKENNINQNKVDRRIKVNKIREIDVEAIKKQKENYLLEKKKVYQEANENNVKNNEKTFAELKIKENSERVRIEKLQKEIIDLIKKKLVRNINELEILQSELYLLKEVNGEDLYLKDCQDQIKEIKKLLSKIKALKEKYDFLKDNVDFEYMLEYGDDLLIDKILELKDLCSSDDIKHVISDYKILDEYKFLYLKIDKLQEDVVKYEDYKNDKSEELKKRDFDFNRLKEDVYDVDRDKEGYDRFVKEQEMYLKNLESKLLNIDSHEYVSYKLKGFGQLVKNSFKYMGLLLVNPLKGLIPGIATQTVVTRNIIHNLYNNLEVQENRKMVYEAIDYSSSINIARNNLDSTLSMVNSTLEDIVRLKAKYMKDFGKYEYSLPGYRDTIKKINKMENAVLGSKIKIELMQSRMKQKELQNKDKMKRVKKLNSTNNN